MTNEKAKEIADKILRDATTSELQTLATYGYKDELFGFSADDEFVVRCAVQDAAKARVG
jgi:hypothetical protein